MERTESTCSRNPLFRATTQEKYFGKPIAQLQREAFKMDDCIPETKYPHSLLVTAQALEIAREGLEFAVRAIEAGTPSAFHVEQIRKDIARIKELMK